MTGSEVTSSSSPGCGVAASPSGEGTERSSSRASASSAFASPPDSAARQRRSISYQGRSRSGAVFADPQHDYTRLLLASVPVISEEEARLRPVIPLIDGEIPTAEQLMALRRAGVANEMARKVEVR